MTPHNITYPRDKLLNANTYTYTTRNTDQTCFLFAFNDLYYVMDEIIKNHLYFPQNSNIYQNHDKKTFVTELFRDNVWLLQDDLIISILDKHGYDTLLNHIYRYATKSIDYLIPELINIIVEYL